MSYLVGQEIRLEVSFTDVALVAADPTTVQITIQYPDNSQHVITGGSIIHDDTGKYHIDIVLAQAGTYLYRWDGEGAIIAIREGSVTAVETSLVPQPVAEATPPNWTQADLIALNKAIASGANRVKFADREMQYNSLSDMLKAQSIITDYLNGQTGTTTRRQLRVYTGSGW